MQGAETQTFSSGTSHNPNANEIDTLVRDGKLGAQRRATQTGSTSCHQLLYSESGAQKETWYELLGRIIGFGMALEPASARRLRPKGVVMYDDGVWLS